LEKIVTSLDATLALRIAGEGLFHGHSHASREANTGMFGGWTAALLLKAVLEDTRAEGFASAICVNYISRVVPGRELTLRTRPLGGSRSLTHWRSELFLEGSEDLAATATVILTQRRESDHFTEGAIPDVPAPETLPMMHPPPRFGETIDMRIASGSECFNQPTTRTVVWQREMTGRLMDAVQIAYLSDIGWPRVFAISSAPRPSSTVTLSVYIHATAQQLAACGDDYVLCDMIGTRILHSTVGSKANLWSRGGDLLATTEQMCWFR
jgi:acyl-CoA thioesterase